jgi:hypothetical protein
MSSAASTIHAQAGQPATTATIATAANTADHAAPHHSGCATIDAPTLDPPLAPARMPSR